MVITVLEAKVKEENWRVLKETYAKETANISEAEGIHQTFLVQSKSRPKTWRIITHWRSREDLDQMRQAVKNSDGGTNFQCRRCSTRA
jgi:heme-degrading monooxygenase HmoA